VGALCAAAALAGWQAAVLAGLAGLVLAGRALRDRERSWTEAVPFLLGGAIGVALSLSWTRWVYGDLATLGDKFFRRSGESGGTGLDDMVSFQVPWLLQLLGLGIVGLASCVAALWDRRARALAGMSLGIVALYAIAFRQAAAGHQYWNYWALLPTAVGFAWAFGRISTEVPARARGAVLAGACVVMGGMNLLVLDNEALRYVDDGREVAELVVASPYPADQEIAPYVGPPYRPDAWLAYYTGLPARQITSPDALDGLADDDVVVVLGWCDRNDPALAFCERTVGGAAPDDGAYRPPEPRVMAAGALRTEE
jgi:hypothetical protein